MADENIYETESRQELVDDAEISPEEDAFMKGYEDAGEPDEEKEETDEEE